jgi:hypothetical protein
MYFQFIDTPFNTTPTDPTLTLTLTPDPLTLDPRPHSTPLNDPGTPNKPGYRVRKQTRNIAAVMRQGEGKGRYYLFLEDDMRFCPSGLLSIQVLPYCLSVRMSVLLPL